MAAAEPARFFFPSRPGSGGYFHNPGSPITTIINNLKDPPPPKKTKAAQWDTPYRDDSIKYHIRKFLENRGYDPDNMLCPKHPDKHTGNFSLEPHGTNYYCFSCKQAVDIYDFAAAEYGLDIKADFNKIKFLLETELGIKAVNRQPAGPLPAPPNQKDGPPPVLDTGADTPYHAKVEFTAKAVNSRFKNLFSKQNTLLELNIKGPALFNVKDRRLRVYASAACDFIDKYGRLVTPPDEIIQGILGVNDRLFRPISEIKTYPELTAAGEIRRSGYDVNTGNFYIIPDLPSISGRGEAVRVLDDLFIDFRFVSPADKAAVIALMLTFIMHGKINGLRPAFITRAPVQGSGKSLLNRVILSVILGRPPAVMVLPRNEDELQKKLGADILAGSPYFFIDNIKTKLNSEHIAASITSEFLKIRVLGASEIRAIPNNYIFIMTANNPSIDKDLLRRMVPIDLDQNREDPENISPGEFTHPDIMRYALENRPRILAALLCIAKQGGEYRGPLMGSFEKWSAAIGSALAGAGIPGFLENLRRLRETSDESETAIADFVESWAAEFREASVQTSDLLDNAEEAGLIPDRVNDRKHYLGKIIGKNTNRVINGWKITRAGIGKGKARYQLKKILGPLDLPPF
jgi:hypothetical protein